jgi:rhodanese-related sulfurtransferase
VHVPIHRLELDVPLTGLDPRRPTVVVCKKGLRSGCALERLQRLGFTDLRSLEGGLRALYQEQLT